MEEKLHPTLNILVRSNGEVLVPATKRHYAHWTFGYNCNGYRSIYYKGKAYFVHRLVVEAFIGPISEGLEVDHIDRNRSNNTVTNLRIVTSSQNARNRADHDRIEARGGTHKYENLKQYDRERMARYRAEHPGQAREAMARYMKTRKYVLFADGKIRSILKSEAEELLKLPVNERIWQKNSNKL